jgi:pilus biogenesis lipoprotein CpaD
MRKMKFIVSTLSVFLLGACSSFSPTQHIDAARDAEQRDFRTGNRVDFVQFNHAVTFDRQAVRPSDPEKTRLQAFIRGIRLGYADEITVRGSTPARREAIQVYLKGTGIPVTIRAEVGNPAEMKANTVKILVERYVVTPPACPNWSNLSGDNNRNTPGSNYGCSVDASLGHMVANPKDLVTGRDASPSQSEALVKHQGEYYTDKLKVLIKQGTR